MKGVLWRELGEVCCIDIDGVWLWHGGFDHAERSACID